MTCVRPFGRASISLVLVALLATGCSEKPSVTASTQEGKVTGKVTIRGKPMKGGQITFDPANYQRKDAPARSGKINDDGTYEVTTLVGHNSVVLSGPAITKEPGLAYANTSIEVESGGSKLDIELPPPASAAAAAAAK